MPYLLAIIMGALLTLITQGLFRKLVRRGLCPKVASGLLTFGLIVLVFAPVFLFITLAAKQAITIGQSIGSSEYFSSQFLISKISTFPIVEILGVSPEEITVQVHDWIQSGVSFGTTLSMSLVAMFPKILLQLVLTSASYFFILVDGGRFSLWIGNKIPFDKKVGERVKIAFRDTAIASIWSTVAAGASQSVVIFLGYLFLGVPGSFLAAGITFLFSWIPFVGSSPVWISGAIYLAINGFTGRVIAMVIFGIAAGVIDNIVRPLVLKGRSDLHPLVGAFAIIGGIGFFGIMGVFLGPIFVAVLISLLRAWPDVADRFGIMAKAQN